MARRVRGRVIRGGLRTRVPTWEAIRTERFKYVRYPALGAGFDELYDLQNDPYELRNQARNPSMSSTRDALRGEMGRLLTFPAQP